MLRSVFACSIVVFLPTSISAQQFPAIPGHWATGGSAERDFATRSPSYGSQVEPLGLEWQFARDSLWSSQVNSPFRSPELALASQGLLIRAQSSGDSSGGAGAAQSVDPSQPLAQIRFQNYFIPSTRGADGYANTFVIQPVIPVYLNSDIVPYHILRPTLPILKLADSGLPPGEGQGVGDLTFVDVYAIPLDGIKSTVGGGYTALLPTSTDPSVGLGEWQIGPAIFGVTRAVPKWVIGFLVQAPCSVESDAYELQMQPVVTRLMENEWYFGWGNTLLKFDDQHGNYSIPMQVKLGKVITLGKQPIDIFFQVEYIPAGFQEPAGEEWAVMLNIGTLLPGLKIGPFCSGHDCCRR